MRRPNTLVTVAALAFLTASLAAQANFAGKWTLDPASVPAPPADGGGGVDVVAAAAACWARN